MSDEHESYLEWHDAEVKNFGGNEWAAWSKPKAARKKLISGILKIKTPLIFTFRAREKTKQNPDPNAKRNEKIINIGWQPVAPLEIVHTLDLTCILPPRADGVPVWHSEKIGEDFIIKLPNYLAPHIKEGKPLSEEMGASFARWAKGGVTNSASASADAKAAPSTESPDSPQDGAASIQAWEEYVDRWAVILTDADDAKKLHDVWGAGRAMRNTITWPEDSTFDDLKARVEAKIKALKG